MIKLKYLSTAVIFLFTIASCGGGGSSDSSSGSDTGTTQPTTPTNSAPMANAGSDVSIELGDTAMLSASASSDADGDTLTYAWSVTSSPTGSTATLSSTTAQDPSIMPDMAGSYQISLIVNDGTVDSDTATITITVTEVVVPPSNTQPIADAGDDVSVEVGATAMLSGSASSDADGDTLTYAWSITNSPSGSSASLSSMTSEATSLTPDVAGSYQISLVVNDGTIDSDAAMVTVTATDSAPTNNAPTAHAGDAQTTTVGDFVSLSGTMSSDADGDTLTYEWAISSQPDSSIATLDDSTLSQPTFNADAPGTFEITLIVNDGTTNSSPDTVTISADNDAIDITDKIFTNIASNCLSYVGSYFSDVTDIKRATDYDGDIVLTSTATHCSLEANSIPNHDFNDATASFASNVGEYSLDFSFPITPTVLAEPQTLSIGVTEAILLNGVTVDILPAACYNVGDEELGEEKIGCSNDEIDNPWRYDPMSTLNNFGTDSHNAHPQPSGKYHYHGNPVAMFDQTCDSTISSVIGFAADGFPIIGSCIKDPDTNEIRKVTSSYQLKDNGGPRQDVDDYLTPTAGNGNIASDNYDGQFRGDWEFSEGLGDLDECNGMTVDGQYGYYVTDSYPWVINCFKGEVDGSFSGGPGNLQRRMHSHDGTTTHSH